MSSILETAQHNVLNNSTELECIEDAKDLALTYVSQFASSISSNINQVEDKAQLAQCLQHQIIGNAYVLKVCCKYLEEVERNMELEIEEMVESITSQTAQEEQ